MQNGMIIRGIWEKFLTLKGEELLLVKRKHPLTLILAVSFISLIFCLFIFGTFILFVNLFSSPSLFIATALLLVSMGLTAITKCIVDWYFHVYILTTRKILEIWYTPLSGHAVNDILLDKVSCTEVDLKRSGFLHELFDMGDIVVTFDRPTHQEEFVFKDIQDSYKLGVFLTQRLLEGEGPSKEVKTIWLKDRRRDRMSVALE